MTEKADNFHKALFLRRNATGGTFSGVSAHYLGLFLLNQQPVVSFWRTHFLGEKFSDVTPLKSCV